MKMETESERMISLLECISNIQYLTGWEHFYVISLNGMTVSLQTVQGIKPINKWMLQDFLEKQKDYSLQSII